MTAPSANAESMSLAEALQAEIDRVRDEVLPLYAQIGPAGMWHGVAMLTPPPPGRRKMFTV